MDWKVTEGLNGNEEMVGRDALISHPNFSEEFITTTDASKTQFKGVISRKW